jgi:hypothetical protein
LPFAHTELVEHHRIVRTRIGSNSHNIERPLKRHLRRVSRRWMYAMGDNQRRGGEAEEPSSAESHNEGPQSIHTDSAVIRSVDPIEAL